MKNGDYILVKAPEDYPGKRYRGKYCQEHVLNYWKHYGVVPNKNEIIHHKDENKNNNDWTNLELKSRSGHTAYHGIEKGRKAIKFICPVCNKICIKYKNNTGYGTISKINQICTCSRNCAGKLTSFTDMQKEEIKRNMIIEEITIYKPIYYIS